MFSWRSASEPLVVWSTLVDFFMQKQRQSSSLIEEKLNLDDSQWEDIHVVTGALKMFFRELPEPLFPYCFFEQFVKAITGQNYRLLFTKIRYSSSTFSSAGPVWTSCQIPGSFLARTTHSQVSQ
ncbi:rho GTPase-activating protein 15 isoform X3 [Paroedura picta]|uniref:rho GTPase-activating protein 15 isoform X3 n=1 Tax=Paroedura picta TaxID=143630 RepID=UPI00405651F9